MLAVGLMSGTSLDGLDVALVEITGKNEATRVKLIDFLACDMPEILKERIKQALSLEASNVALICSLNFELAYYFAEGVKAICQKNNIATQDLGFVASHGQTIYHLPIAAQPEVPSTLQIGESSILAEELKTTIISDLRYRDMAVGGQGAPIVPYSEYVMYRDETQTRLLQNIGGIGNVTVMPKGASLADICAFDTGPGNMIIDEFCRRFFQKEYDENGFWGAKGTINEEALRYMMSHPYINAPYPKTTGREDFGEQYVDELLENFNLAPMDWIATATEFTALSIAENVKPFVTGPTQLIVGGGGSYNQTLIRRLTYHLRGVEVITQEDIGYSSEAKEAIAMAVLGNQTFYHLPSNVPSATKAHRPVILGKITYY